MFDLILGIIIGFGISILIALSLYFYLTSEFVKKFG